MWESISGLKSTKEPEPINEAVVAGLTSTQLVGPSGERIVVILTNDGTDTVYLKLGNAPAVINSSLRMLPGQSFQIDKDFPWVGAVHGICATTASNVVITGLNLVR